MFATAASRTAWLDALNAEQRAAAEHEGGPLLILAGAGTGKTTTLARAWPCCSSAACRPSASCC